MAFGRQSNMVRRALRPDESYHRNRRRRAVDRSAMLESHPSRTPVLVRLLRLVGLAKRR
ncbi:MAG TPA: hypothetical protein VH370_25480 [Humisphaera sp.]|jgi:hypothetical protein|nr:hypothetical protein [Humisphaera sp.]